MLNFNQNNNDQAMMNADSIETASATEYRKRTKRRRMLAIAIGSALMMVPVMLNADDSTTAFTTPPAETPVEAVPQPIVEESPAVEVTDSITAPVMPIALAAEAALPSATQPVVPATQPVVAMPLTDKVAGMPVIITEPATRPADAVATLFDNVPVDGRVSMLVGRSFVLKTKAPYKRISLTQPEVVGDNLVDPNSILLTAKKAGTTQLIVWDDKEHSEVLDVVVDVDLNALTELVKKNFPGSEVKLSAVNGTLMMRGRVTSLQTAEQITEMLSAYGKVLNFLEMAGGQQVMLQVRFAEVSRSATTALGVNFGFADGNAGRFGNNLGTAGAFGNGDSAGSLTRTVGANVTLFGGGRIGSTEFDVMLSALRNNNLLRVLAEPNLATLSGKQAEFLAGGEFPIPVPQSGGSGNAAITVEYKQFGIRLTFTPIVLGDGKIRIQGTAEVSDLDYNKSVSIGGFNIPSLTKRTVTTTIELSEGQTFSLAGLLNNRVTANKSAVPLLGDIPVLGALFRSVRYERSETELVVLVTPRLVEGMNPKQVPELPGERWSYPSETDLFLKQYLGGPAADPGAANKPGPAAFRGPYGFVPAGKPVAARSPAGERVTGLNNDVRAE